MADSIFTVKDLSFAYGKQPVLQHLDVQFQQGKITTLIGANGCGKSTLFHLMTKMMIMTSPFNSSEKMISGMTEFSKVI